LEGFAEKEGFKPGMKECWGGGKIDQNAVVAGTYMCPKKVVLGGSQNPLTAVCRPITVDSDYAQKQLPYVSRETVIESVMSLVISRIDHCDSARRQNSPLSNASRMQPLGSLSALVVGHTSPLLSDNFTGFQQTFVSVSK